MLSPPPQRIVVVYGEWQTEYEHLRKLFPWIEFLKGPMQPSLYDSFRPEQNNLLVLDDQMLEAGRTQQLEKYFVQGSHHRNLSVVFIVQNIFEKGKAQRTTSLNSNYIVLYKNPRDSGQAAVLGRQMYPSKWRQFVSAFQTATIEPYSYLLVDFMPSTPEELRLRGHIFPSDPSLPTVIYVL